MAIAIKNQLVQDLLNYLEKQPESDSEAEDLYHQLLQEQVEDDIYEMKVDGEYPQPTKGGSWIV
jgi:hypothetical protein